MEGGEVDDEAFVVGLEPGASFGSGLQRRVGDAGQLGYGVAERVVVVGGEVVHDVVDDRIGRQGTDLGGEDAAEGFAAVVGDTLAKDAAGSRIEEGQQIGDAVASVVEVAAPRLVGLGGQIRAEALQGLDAGAFVETEQVLWGVEVQRQQMVHLGEEVGIRDLQIVAPPMRTERVVLQDAMHGGAADGSVEQLRMGTEMGGRQPQRPGVDAGQGRRLLAEDGDGGELCGLAETARASAAGSIGQALFVVVAGGPAGHGAHMDLRHSGNRARLDPALAQGNDETALLCPRGTPCGKLARP